MNSLALDPLMADSARPSALTLDVFDTALTRCWARPQHLFLACAPRLRALGLVALDDEGWMHARQRAEARAIQQHGHDMARLADIYRELATGFGWTPQQAEAASAIELTTEQASVRALPRTLALWQRMGRDGKPVRFLSDMYLPETVVASLLKQVGYGIDLRQVWVSAERQASKRQGRLFTLALEAWQHLAPQQVLHVGDHPISDIRHARRAGLRAVHVNDAALPTSAQRLLTTSEAPLLLRSAVAGAMRLALLNAPSRDDTHTTALWQLGSCHAGPLLALCVWWLLSHAQAQGLKRLYFLARDGQVLQDIARVLQAQGVGAGIELRYLHASRQAWFAPSITAWDEASLFRLLDEPDRLNDPAKLARRLGFANADALRAQWPALTDALQPGLSNRDVARLLQRTVPHGVGLAHTERLRHDALGYFAQQGLFDGTPWAIVDLGWRGRLQESLARIVRSHPEAAHLPASGYYLGLIETPTLPAGWQAFAFSPVGSPLPGPAHLLELFCEADHGSTRGYARDAHGVVHPVFEPQADPAMTHWGLGSYRQAVHCYAQQLADTLPLLGTSPPATSALLALARTLGREFFHRPDLASAQAFARMPCSYSVNHDAAADLSPPLGVFDAWCRALSLGRLVGSRQTTPWLPGSLARSSPSAHRVYLRLHRLADTLRQRFKRVAWP